MMKQTLLLACAAVLALAGGAQAQEFTVGGIEYGLYADYGRAYVNGYTGSPVDVVIPATVEYGGESYSVTEISSYAFAECASLESVTLPQGMTDIYESAFQDCAALKNVSLPEGLEYISDQVFYGCTSLESLVLPEGLQKTCWLAFAECASLKIISFPSTFQEMEGPTFRNTPLEHIACHAVVPPAIMDDDFDAGTYAVATLHVPVGTADAYRAAAGWKNFLAIKDDAEMFTGIADVPDASLATYANGILTTSGLAEITVYAQSGAQVLHATDATTLDLNALPRGIYIISIEQGGQRQVLKVAR